MKKFIKPLLALITFTAISVNANANAIDFESNLSSTNETTPVVEIFDLNNDQFERFTAARKFYKELLEQLEIKHNEVIQSIVNDTMVSD